MMGSIMEVAQAFVLLVRGLDVRQLGELHHALNVTV